MRPSDSVISFLPRSLFRAAGGLIQLTRKCISCFACLDFVCTSSAFLVAEAASLALVVIEILFSLCLLSRLSLAASTLLPVLSLSSF